MLVLRKTIHKSIENLTIEEILELLNSWKCRPSSNSDLYFDIITNIENDNFQTIDISNKLMIELCQQTLTLAMKLNMCTQNFQTNFVKRLVNHQILTEKAYFVQITYGGINYRILTKLGNHETISMINDEKIRINYSPINSSVFDYRDGNWFSDNYAVDRIMLITLDKYKRGIMFIRQLFHIMTINQFDLLDDIKYFIKGFLLLDKDIKIK